ncbi:MAG: hypothetical protein HY548_01290 [Elusimicrobia bacterium]|nr:hypothetical protein [Elusimicrobiota bacterium]
MRPREVHKSRATRLHDRNGKQLAELHQIFHRPRITAQVFGHNDGILGAAVIKALMDGPMGFRKRRSALEGRALFGGRERGDYGVFGRAGDGPLRQARHAPSGDRRTPTFEELARYAGVPERNRGNLIGALRALSLMGLLTETRQEGPQGVDDLRTRYALTEQGRLALDLAKEGVYDDIVGASAHFVNYWHFLRGPPRSLERWVMRGRALLLSLLVSTGFRPAYTLDFSVRPESRQQALAELKQLVEKDTNGWNLSHEGRVADQVRDHLRGALRSSVLLALWRNDDRSDAARVLHGPKGKRSILYDLLKDKKINLKDLSQAYDRAFLDVVFDYLARDGFVAIAGNEVSLTELGKIFLEKTGSYGVTHAYLKSYAISDELFWGNPDPWGISEDKQLDRLEDIQASKDAHHNYLKRNIYPHLKGQFDRPIEEQSAGITVIGVGSGELAAQEIKYVVEQTERRNHLDTHPLYFVAVDLSLESLQTTEVTLQRELGALEGIEVIWTDRPPERSAKAGKGARRIYVTLLRGDMNKPQKINEDLLARRIPVVEDGAERPLSLKDLVAMQEFGPHDRGVSVLVDNVQDALTLMRERIVWAKRNNAEALQQVLGELGVKDIPSDDEALITVVLNQFTTPFTNKGQLVPAVVGGADLVAFFLGWSSASAALLALDLHSARTNSEEEPLPRDLKTRMRFQKSALGAYQLSQVLTQTIMPFYEHKLAAVLAGFTLQYRFDKAKKEMDLLPGKELAIVSMATYTRPVLEEPARQDLETLRQRDASFMRDAIQYQRAATRERKNPFSARVGAVVVKDGRVIGGGYNHYGPLHAEHFAVINSLRFEIARNTTLPLERRTALETRLRQIELTIRRPVNNEFHERLNRDLMRIDAALGHVLRGTEVFVTLGTCNKCSQILADLGVGRVVVAVESVNPKHNAAALKKAGIEIATGVLADEARRWTWGYLFVVTRLPRLYEAAQRFSRLMNAVFRGLSPSGKKNARHPDVRVKKAKSVEYQMNFIEQEGDVVRVLRELVLGGEAGPVGFDVVRLEADHVRAVEGQWDSRRWERFLSQGLRALRDEAATGADRDVLGGASSSPEAFARGVARARTDPGFRRAAARRILERAMRAGGQSDVLALTALLRASGRSFTQELKGLQAGTASETRAALREDADFVLQMFFAFDGGGAREETIDRLNEALEAFYNRPLRRALIADALQTAGRSSAPEHRDDVLVINLSGASDEDSAALRDLLRGLARRMETDAESVAGKVVFISNESSKNGVQVLDGLIGQYPEFGIFRNKVACVTPADNSVLALNGKISLLGLLELLRDGGRNLVRSVRLVSPSTDSLDETGLSPEDRGRFQFVILKDLVKKIEDQIEKIKFFAIQA